jgi:osmotically-inducible protein OsmY
MKRDSDRTLPEKSMIKRVQALFEDEPRINLHRHPIRLVFAGEDLILEGEAENIAAKKLALELAASVPTVGRIVDRLRVVPAERMSDAEIRDRVYRALLQEPAFSTCAISARLKGSGETPAELTPGSSGHIHVDVENGVVTLNGQVSSLSHKRLAGVLAWWVPGSRDVINGLEETPPEKDSDDEITDAVRLTLEKDPFVKSDQIQVVTTNSVVTLEGVVSSENARRMAEFDAWYVFGVDKVINDLGVRP